MEYKRYFTEADDKDLNELVGELKGQFKTIKQVKGCTKFKALSSSDKEYVIDELKSDGFKESVMKEASFKLNLKDAGVKDLMDFQNLIKDLKDENINWNQPKPGSIEFDSKEDLEKVKELLGESLVKAPDLYKIDYEEFTIDKKKKNALSLELSKQNIKHAFDNKPFRVIVGIDDYTKALKISRHIKI